MIPALIMLAVAVASAAAQANAQRQALKVAGEAARKNTLAQFGAIEEQDRAAGDQSAEAMTDRMAAASRQMSMAGVLAAEGAGGLRGRADNIMAAAALDASRLEAGTSHARSGIREEFNNARVSFEGRNAGFQTEAKNIRVQFLTSVANSVASAYAGSAQKAADVKAATNYTADYNLTGSGQKIKFGGP